MWICWRCNNLSEWCPVLISYKLNTHLLKTEAWICLCKCKRNGHVNVSVAPVYLQFGTMSLIVSLFWPHYASISKTYPDRNVCGRIFGCGEWSFWKTMTHLLLVQWALIYWFVLFFCQKRRNSRNWDRELFNMTWNLIWPSFQTPPVL